MKELIRLQTNVYNNVKRLCYLEDISSMRKFEVMCGLGRGYLKRCKNGKKNLTLATLIRMASTLGVEVTELLED